MKVLQRFLAIFCSVVLAALTVMPVLTATAIGPNIVPNASMETAVSGKPSSWASNKWGTNTTTFTYNTSATAAHTGTGSVTTKMTARTSGDAKWYFTPVAVSPNTSYTVSNWYKSTTKSTLDIEVTTTANTKTYIWLGDLATSAGAWKQSNYTFTTPANATKITIYHSLTSAGEITTDDYSLATTNGTSTPPTAPSTPTATMTAPAAGSTISGTTALTADSTDTQGVASVQFKVDGTNVGTPDTTAPYSYNWDSKTVANGSHSFTAVATNTVGLTTTSSAVSATVSNTVTPTPPTTPTVSISAPTVDSTVSNSVNVNANASDTAPLAGVQFKLDGVNLGAEDTTAPYSVAWDTKTATDGPHSLTAVARNTAGGSATSAAVSVTVSNPTAPTLSVTAPTANATVSGTTTLGANASDAKSITSVQFKVDGTNVGSADTTAPYSFDWDSKSVANGNHTVTAVATNPSNLTTTSSAVTINVQNTVAPPPAPTPTPGNLIGNESVENGTPAPTGWTSNAWGTNTPVLSYENTGRTGSRSVKAALTSYTDGDAKWYFNSVPVTAGKTYNYSNWYKSNVTTELDAMVTMSNGSVQYYWLGSLSASPADWQKASAQFIAPAGAVSITIFQVVYSVGYVQTDDFSLTEYQPQKFNRALVSITFDDGWRNIHTNGLPLLQKYGLTSTQYLNSEPVIGGYPDYMTYQMIKEFQAAGHELGWHTRTHANVTTLSASALNTELTIPAAFLTGTGTAASAFQNFATPFGAYNDTSVNAIMAKYRSHRSTDVGYNTKDNFNIRNIKVQNITNTTTPADVQAWVAQAQADQSWLVIVYHEVTATAEDPTYAVTPANLDAELNIIKQSGVTVKTVQQALDEITAQL